MEIILPPNKTPSNVILQATRITLEELAVANKKINKDLSNHYATLVLNYQSQLHLKREPQLCQVLQGKENLGQKIHLNTARKGYDR